MFSKALTLLCFFPLLVFSQSEKSIYSVDPYLDGALIFSGATIVGLSYFKAELWTGKRCPCNPNEVNSFDRGAIGNNSAFARTASDIMVVGAVVCPVIYEYINLGWSKAFWEDATVFAEAVLVNGGIVTMVKYLAPRPIPLAYSGQKAGDADGYHSFYSGHTSTTASALAATAMMLSLRHGSKVWPWVGAGVLTTTMGLLRVAGGNHFYSDIIVGGLVGTGIGILIPWLHELKTESSQVSLAPIGDRGVAFVYQLKI